MTTLSTLKERIKSKGLKQKWIAEQLDINVNTMNAYLGGFLDMPQEVSDKIKKLIE